MNTSPLWTVRSLIAWSTPWLAQRGVESPRLDSELLLARVLTLRRIDLFLDPHRPLSAPELAAFKELVKRRAAREPVAYILERREFWGLEFLVRREALIPRPETELLVETVLTRCPDRNEPLRILEPCVGSGALIAALMTEYPMAAGTGTDLSADALKVAAENMRRHVIADRVNLLEGDLDGPIPPGERFDVVVVNPPYIASGELATLQPEVRAWEPRLALDGGTDGLSVLTKIPAMANRRLRPGGLLLSEIGCDQGEAVRELFRRGGFENAEIINDYNRLPRCVAGNAK